MKRLMMMCAVLVVMFSAKSWAAITFSSAQQCVQTSVSVLTCTASMTFASGDVVVLYASEHGSGFSYSVSDTCGQTWTHQPSASFTEGSAIQIDAWTVASAIAGTCSITVTRSAGTIRHEWVAASYSGAGELGTITSGGNMSSGTCSVSLTTQDNNNFVVAGIANNASSETYTGSTGNLRTQTANFGSAGALSDNTASTPSSVTNTVTLSANAACAKGAIEVRTCGPPSYGCANTTFNTINNLNPPPTLASQNSIATPSELPAPILRVTDSNTFVASGATPPGKSFYETPSGSNEDNIFSCGASCGATTDYLIIEDGGSWRYPIAFDPSSFQVLTTRTALGGTFIPGNPPTSGNEPRWTGPVSFSRTSANKIYTVLETDSFSVTPPSSKGGLYALTLSGTAPISITASLLTGGDLATCPGMPSGYVKTSGTTITVSRGDGKIAVGMSNSGGQGTGFDALVYDLNSGTCVRYDTGGTTNSTGVGQYCTGNNVTFTCTPMNLPDTYALHEVYISQDGNWMRLVPTPAAGTTCSTIQNCNGFPTSDPYFWQIGTTTVTRCAGGSPAALCAGHGAMGYSHYNNMGATFPQVEHRSFSSLLTYTLDNTDTVASGSDTHLSANEMDTSDSFPVWITNYGNINTAFHGAGCQTGNIYLGCTFPGPLYGEIWGMGTAGTYLREGHTYDSGSSSSFGCGDSIGSVSQDGKFFAVSTDWLTTWGSDDNGAVRCDVVIYKLQ